MPKPLKLPVATADPLRRIERPARLAPLAARVLGIVAALLTAFVLACTPERDPSPPSVTPAVPAGPIAPAPVLPSPAAPPPPVSGKERPAPALPTATLPAAPIAAPPPPPGSPRLVQLSVGSHGQCGVGEEGRVFCQGWDYLREPAPTAARFRQVSLGQYYACGRRGDGTIACWGDSRNSKTTPPPGQFTQVDAGDQHACALDSAGYAHCWGWDRHGRATPPAGIAFSAIAAGGVHSCGLTPAGALHCWGKNTLGQADFHRGPFQSLALGERHTCALRPDGAAWCQGDNSAGQSRPPPGVFTHIAAGRGYTCGLRPGGRLECWGGDFGAELGEPEGAYTALSAGGNVFCALDTAGYPRCWHYLPGSPQPAEPAAAFSAAATAPPLQEPVELFPWPGGGLAVVEREGLILLCRGADIPCAGDERGPLLDLTDRTDLSTSESGMLSAALDPDFDRFPFLYVYYIVQSDPRKARLSRFPVAEGQIDRSGELVILELPLPNKKHYGGAVRFGPDDLLYLGIGDNRSPEAAQSLSSRRGKIIRINVRGASREQPYGIPADNPFQDTAGAQPEIWAYGLRNPWRMSFDDDGRLWVGDVGEFGNEEVSLVTAGANLGWPVFEGDYCYGEELQCAALTSPQPPLATYGREVVCAIIWGGQYRGNAVPSLAGAQIFGDYCSGRVWALTPDGKGGWSRRLAATVSSHLLSFGTDAAGEMYALALNQPPLKLEPISWVELGSENPADGP